MMTEKDKRDRGLWYNADDPELVAERISAKRLCALLSQVPPDDTSRLEELLSMLLSNRGPDVEIILPIYVDYGYNCHIKEGTFINHGAYLMDGAPIRIGAHCQIGPSCGIYTASHPLVASERKVGLEQARAITIGDDVWIGGNVTILPGVTIGEGAVIGAGSVVSSNIPAGIVAAGVPCRPLRPITDSDRIGG